MRKLTTAALTLGALVALSAPAAAGHDHFVYIEATGTCQYVAHGQTAIDDPDHGGHHRFHNNVHTGTPGTEGRGNTFDKEANVESYDCTERGQDDRPRRVWGRCGPRPGHLLLGRLPAR